MLAQILKVHNAEMVSDGFVCGVYEYSSVLLLLACEQNHCELSDFSYWSYIVASSNK